MKINFYKYQGAGNDFVFLNNMKGEYDALTISQIQQLCNRRFGIGADGLIKIDKSDDWDFSVDYYNSDGSKSFCGNGARCAVRFVNQEILKKDKYKFMAIDGVHEGQLIGAMVSVQMNDLDEIEVVDDNTFILNTGSPHFIHFVKDVSNFDIYTFGQKIRFSEQYAEFGINVNAVQITGTNQLAIRTYERGVENETLACGTGITAASIAYAMKENRKGDLKVNVKAQGGDLSVSLHRTEENGFIHVNLIGPAEFVYKGEVDV